MKLPEFPQAGGCACGQVRYRLMKAPPLVYTCHCTDCQTLSTSAFTLSATIPEDTLEITGETRTWDRTTTESGIPQTAYECPTCGVRVYSKTPRTPGRCTLRAGTLDDTSWLWPKAAIWMDSAQPWIRLPEGMLTAPRGEIDWGEVAKRWQAQFE
jgi:hypothetical protein